MINAYALPNGQIVNLPDHCQDAIERFTMRDGMVVWAVQVGQGSEESALRLAAKFPRPRRMAGSE